MLALPMWALFEVGILAGRLVKKRQVKNDDEENNIAG
jgi:Sec-independent protein secretion pathway component TatC